MRDFKCRAIEKSSSGFSYWRCIEGSVELFSVPDADSDYSFDFNTFGQCTEVMDKNGEDIYEDDIIRVECCDADDYITAVRFNGDALCIDVEALDFDYIAMGWAFELPDVISFEVIGNIHQNPDLINSLIQPTLY